MSLDFVAIDFETANAYERGSACALGVAIVKNGMIVNEFYTLLNPKLPFSYQCVRVHGICLQDVVDAPTFPEVWGKLLQMIGDMPFVAHNASFDIPVLERLLYIWKLEPIERHYTCTLRLSKKLCSCPNSYRLSDLCSYYQLPGYILHNAGEDARACAQLCISLARQTHSDSLEDLLYKTETDWETILTNNYFPEDNGEIRWPDIPTLRKHSECIRNELFVDGPVFAGLSFVFTGELISMERHAAEAAVKDHAGIVLSNVSRKVNILVVGLQDPNVIRGEYSTKHVKALQLKQKGHPLEIVDENLFLDWLFGESTDFLLDHVKRGQSYDV